MPKEYMSAVIAAIGIAAIAATSCHSSRDAGAQPSAAVAVAAPGVRRAPIMGGSQAMPKAVIYRTNGDYSAYVPVTLNAQRDGLVSYPAPSDLSDDSTPLSVGGGWMLDRRGGVGINTAFLRYTYAQYRRLSHVDASMLMQAIMPDARVTEVKVLPVTAAEAIADPEIINRYIDITQ